jgi:hypothetical protein
MEDVPDIQIPVAPSSQDKAIKVGMTIKEAIDLGGDYIYVLKRDASRWPQGTDPRRVISEQSRNPDRSEIKLIFRNATQYGGRATARFEVMIKEGRVAAVNRLD